MTTDDGREPIRPDDAPPHDHDAVSGEPGAGEATPPETLAELLGQAEERLLRTQAELENFRKRARREYEDALRYREIDLLRDLLPVLDTVRRAIDAAATTADVDSLRAGFRMTAQQLEKVLDSHGCKPIETDGKPFDPTVHEAILQQSVPGVAAGTVVGVASHGYRLHDRVVRPAQVIVSKED
ncbi:MAG: nucleotide exchange factor GrpE [Planctomycetia bacterium]|nr:nucleotide exchange factor GrpE [Planctomycetia bacterium]